MLLWRGATRPALGRCLAVAVLPALSAAARLRLPVATAADLSVEIDCVLPLRLHGCLAHRLAHPLGHPLQCQLLLPLLHLACAAVRRSPHHDAGREQGRHEQGLQAPWLPSKLNAARRLKERLRLRLLRVRVPCGRLRPAPCDTASPPTPQAQGQGQGQDQGNLQALLVAAQGRGQGQGRLRKCRGGSGQGWHRRASRRRSDDVPLPCTLYGGAPPVARCLDCCGWLSSPNRTGTQRPMYCLPFDDGYARQRASGLVFATPSGCLRCWLRP